MVQTILRPALVTLLATTLPLAGCLENPDGQERDTDDVVLSAQPRSHPTNPGQSAFGSIKEIVDLLEADPSTDWSRVRFDLLREHLIDMDELTLRAEVAEEALPKGIEATITGDARTAAAIQRMVPTHASMTLSNMEDWVVSVEMIESGAILRVMTDAPHEIGHIQGLGFIGLMAYGSDHPIHHMMMAKGEMMNH